MRQKRGVLAVVCATAFLLAGALAWAGEVHVYTDREIRPALLELLNGAQEAMGWFAKEPRQAEEDVTS